MQLSIFGPQGEQDKVFDYLGKNGVYVDVGANEPFIGSQTYLLEENGWDGLLIEPQPDLADKLRNNRSGTVVECALGQDNDPEFMTLYLAGGHTTLLKNELHAQDCYSGEIQVPIRTLDNILIEHKITNVDLLSIDVEGFELHVLKGISLEKYRPRLLLLEDHVLDLDLHKYIVKKDYKLVRRTGLNTWYIPNEQDFPVGLWGRWQLFRKLYIGTPWRAFKHNLQAKG